MSGSPRPAWKSIWVCTASRSPISSRRSAQREPRCGGSRSCRATERSPRATRNIFDVNVSATWEIDLWGKIRRATEAARANLLAAEEARRGVVLSIVGLVADSYIDLLSLDKQLVITRSTAGIRKKALDLFQQRYKKGDVSELELSQIESQYWLALSDIPALEREIAQRENALNVLLGRNPGPIPRGMAIDSLPLIAIPEGLPSEILEDRPDVRQAEEQLRSANAQIGVAKAAYFPSISLTGMLRCRQQ